MEFAGTAETSQHRHHGVNLRYHVDEFLHVDIHHVIIKTRIYMVSSRSLVDGGQLESCGIAYETHLFQHKHTFLHIEMSAQLPCHLVEDEGFRYIGIESEVNILRHKICVCLPVVAFGCLGLRLLRTAFGRGQRHQFVHIGMSALEIKFSAKHALVLKPRPDVMYLSFQREIGVAEYDMTACYIKQFV